jgi:DNA-binding NarL/FixJ family response regulator
MLTASADEPDIKEAYRLGANAFLTKPSEASKLEDMVKAIKAFWLTHNTVPGESSPESAAHRTFNLRLSLEPSGIKSLFQADALTNNCLNGNGHPRPALAQSLLNNQQPHAAQPRRAPPTLTKRQIEVMQLIAEGFSSREIARQCSVTTKTVEKHRQALMDKLNIHDIATLTRYAVSCGLVECEPGPRAIQHSGAREIIVGLRRDSRKTS